jgi:4-hydroxy-tetrahydrodipicolinate reductase
MDDMSPPPVRLLIHGASGRMGRALLRLAGEDRRFQVVAACSTSGNALAEAGEVPLFPASALDQLPAFDVAVDFSLPPGFDRILALCRQRGVALVSGTTGLEAAQLTALEQAARQVPVLWAANFSLGVAVLGDLVRRAAQALPQWDCDLIEAHHIQKRDAPSGTALALGAAIRQGRGIEPHYASLRAGDIVGEHLVQFSGLGERLELTHRATNRDIFARGALECAARLHGKPAARYAVADLLLATA